jgi:hypothetical protein
MFLMVRNGSIDETPLVAEAAAALKDGLPKAWRVDVVAEPNERKQPDVLLTLSTADGPEVSFVVEAKTATRASARDLANQLRAVANSYGTDRVVLITDYASPPLRRELEEAEISYVDTTGWAYLTSENPAVMIRLKGANKPPRPRQSAATARLNGPAASRAIRHLLEAQPPLGIRQLAAQSSSSAAAVSKLMPTLVDAGAIERSEGGAITRIRRRTLLDRWTADYSFVNSNGVVLDYIAPRGVARTLERMRGRDDIAVSGSAAAREYLPAGTTSVVPLGLITIYGDDITGIARSLELVRADRPSSNVMLTAPRDRNLLDDSAQSSSSLRIVPVGQVLADLLTLPRGRLAQEAEQLIDVLARDDGTWRA